VGISGFRKEISVKFPLREVDAKVHEGLVRITFRGIFSSGRKAHSSCKLDSTMYAIEKGEKRVETENGRKKS
jgi:hypothetical protein